MIKKYTIGKITDGAIDSEIKFMSNSLEDKGLIFPEQNADVRLACKRSIEDILKWFIEEFQVEGKF